MNAKICIKHFFPTLQQLQKYSPPYGYSDPMQTSAPYGYINMVQSCAYSLAPLLKISRSDAAHTCKWATSWQKATKWQVHQVKTQVSLGIRWCESSLRSHLVGFVMRRLKWCCYKYKVNIIRPLAKNKGFYNSSFNPEYRFFNKLMISETHFCHTLNHFLVDNQANEKLHYIFWHFCLKKRCIQFLSIPSEQSEWGKILQILITLRKVRKVGPSKIYLQEIKINLLKIKVSIGFFFNKNTSFMGFTSFLQNYKLLKVSLGGLHNICWLKWLKWGENGLFSFFLCSTFLKENIWAMLWENLFLPYANNKGADQLAHLHSLIRAFVIRCIDSIIHLVPIPTTASL